MIFMFLLKLGQCRFNSGTQRLTTLTNDDGTTTLKQIMVTPVGEVNPSP